MQQGNKEKAVAGPPTKHSQQRPDQQAEQEIEAEGGRQRADGHRLAEEELQRKVHRSERNGGQHFGDEPDVALFEPGLEHPVQAVSSQRLVTMKLTSSNVSWLTTSEEMSTGRRSSPISQAAKILILTTFDLDEYVYEALRAGASGFVLKDDPPEQLLTAIRVVAAGDALLSPAITKRVIAQFNPRPAPAPPRGLDELTDRELDVFRLIARGLSDPRSRGRSTSARRPSRPMSQTSCRSSISATAFRR